MDDASSRPIQVVVRVRPLQPHEAGHSTDYLQADDAQGVVTLGATGTQSMGPDRYMRNFMYDAVLAEAATQEDLFERARVGEMLEAVLGGFHATLFAYGQTGSGKTHCMEGFKYKRLKVTKAEGRTLEPRAVFDETPRDRLGIVPRAVQALFQGMKRAPDRRYTVRVSYVQIYKEQVYDLLNIASFRGGNAQRSAQGLKMRWSRGQQFYLENVYQCECQTAAEVMALYQSGINNKFMASHKMNAQSSRSHTLFVLQVDSAPTQAPEEVLSSKLTFVDLAGSERGASAGSVEGKLQQESIAINKSLFALRKVITALADGKSVNSPHIPFRDSKLTCLLKHSLGGSSLTTMIACITPSDAYYEENLSTLEYSSRAKAISNQLVRNEDPKTRLIRELRGQVAFLQEQLAAAGAPDPPPVMAATMQQHARPAPGAGMHVPASALPTLEEVAAARQVDDAAVHEAAGGIQHALHLSGTSQPAPVAAPGGAAAGALLPNSSSPLAEPLPMQQRSKEEVIQQVELMGNYLLQSVTALKQVARTNAQLRQAYVKLYQEHQESQAMNDKLMTDTAELTDRVSMLENVVSVRSESTEAPSPNMHTTSSAMALELDSLRRENELLRAWCRNEDRPLPPGTGKPSQQSRGALQRSASARTSHPGGPPSRVQRGSPDSRVTTNHRRSSSSTSSSGTGLLSVKQLETVLSRPSPGRANAFGPHSPSDSGRARHSPMVPAYMVPGRGGGPGGDGTSSYAYSAISGQALRITTTGRLLATASGVAPSLLGSPQTPSGPGPSVERPASSADGTSRADDPQKRLSQLLASRSSLVRSRLTGSGGS